MVGVDLVDKRERVDSVLVTGRRGVGVIEQTTAAGFLRDEKVRGLDLTSK